MNKKKYFWMSLLLCFAASVYGVKCGDVNGDNTADIVDALMVAGYSTGLNISMNTEGADVTGDGVINILDALIIAQFSVGLIPYLPCAGYKPPDVNGTWILDSHINLSLVEDQLIYDHSIQDWTGHVTMSGYENKTVVTDGTITQRYSAMEVVYEITMTTEADVYPHYKFVLIFGEHGARLLRVAEVVISESPSESKRFFSLMQSSHYRWLTHSITTTVYNLPSDDGEEALTLDFEILRDKSLLLQSGEVSKLPYEPYDEVPSMTITGNTFYIFFVRSTDIGIEVKGVVSVDDSSIVLDHPPGSSGGSAIPLPIFFDIIYDEYDNIILDRQVTEPDLEAIYSYYGIDENNLQNYEYNQHFLKYEPENP